MYKYTIGIWLMLLKIGLFAQLPEQKLIPADIDPGDFFGRYLCLKGNDLLIGAHQDDQNGYASGSLYVYQKDGDGTAFIENQKILPEDGDVEEFFGYSIDISNDLAVVGSHHDSDFGGSSGSAFLLQKNAENHWSIIQKLLPDDPHAGDEFGKAVGISGDWIAIGAFLGDDLFTNGGSVYMLQRNGSQWMVFDELYASDTEAYDQLGNFLDLSSDILLVGVPEKQSAGYKSGSAYIFEWTGNAWEETAKLFPEDLREGDEFGQAVAIGQDFIAIGAYKADAPEANGGAVYICQKTDGHWKFIQKVVPPDNEAGDQFGNALSFNGNWLAIGAYFDDDNGSNSGSVYLYHQDENSFQLVSKIKPSDGSAGDAFGAAVSLDGHLLAVGAYADSDQGFFSGSAYVFDLDALVGLEEYISDEASGGTHSPCSITVNPNPAKDFILVQKPASSLFPVPYQLFDARGNLLLRGKLNASLECLDVSQLPSGRYTMVFTTGRSIQKLPLIKITSW